MGLATAGLGLMAPDPQPGFSVIIERIAEVALLISLFSVGLKLGLPFSSPHWRLPLRLAFVSMALTVGLIAAVGFFVLDLPLGVQRSCSVASWRQPTRCWPRTFRSTSLATVTACALA
jgi:NhaP-type Na+/H+ or K+/H+ antiporter